MLCSTRRPHIFYARNWMGFLAFHLSFLCHQIFTQTGCAEQFEVVLCQTLQWASLTFLTKSCIDYSTVTCIFCTSSLKYANTCSKTKQALFYTYSIESNETSLHWWLSKLRAGNREQQYVAAYSIIITISEATTFYNSSFNQEIWAVSTSTHVQSTLFSAIATTPTGWVKVSTELHQVVAALAIVAESLQYKAWNQALILASQFSLLSNK